MNTHVLNGKIHRYVIVSKKKQAEKQCVLLFKKKVKKCLGVYIQKSFGRKRKK